MEFSLGTAGPPLVAAFLAALVCVRGLQGVAPALGLLDQPGGRKVHRTATPVVGGLAMGLALVLAAPFLASALALATGLPAGAALRPWVPLAVAMAALLALGLADDRWHLGSGPKFAVQGLAAGLALFWGGVELNVIGTWPGGSAQGLGWLSAPITLLALVGFVNAFNMTDGVDGLAGSSAVVMLGLLTVAAVLAGAVATALVALALIGAVLGFLWFNLRTPWRPRAAVFMGDAGSLPLGLAIAWLAIEVSQRPDTPVSPVAIAWLLVVPVTDTLSLMIRRMRQGQSPFHPDRRHLHHVVTRAGFSRGQTAWVITGLSLALGLAGLSASLAGVPDVVLAALLGLVAVAHYFFVRYGWRSARALGRLRRWVAAGEAAAPPGIADRLALGGLYAMAVAIPLGWQWGMLAALGLLALASAGPVRGLLVSLGRLPIAGVALALGAWITLAVFLRPEPVTQAWLAVIGLSGVLALPLGWWFTRLRRHAVPLFILAAGVLLGVWVTTVDWAMIEAGQLRQPAHWGGTHAGGLLLVLMLVVLVGLAAASLAKYPQRWRARAGLLFAGTGAVMVLTLIIGLQAPSVVAAALLGLVGLGLAGGWHARGSRLAVSLGLGVGVTLLLAVSLAVAFLPPGASLGAVYGASLAAYLADWGAVAQALVARPLGGYGDPVLARIGMEAPDQSPRSAFAALLLTGGVPALGLFLALLALWVRAVAQACRLGVWPRAQAAVAHGLLWGVLGLLLFSPLVSQLASALIVTAVLALGVMAALDGQRAAARSAGTTPINQR